MLKMQRLCAAVLVCLLCTAALPSTVAKLGRAGREKLQLKVHLKAEQVEPGQAEVYEGLPGEEEYEVDLSDQDRDRHREGESGVER